MKFRLIENRDGKFVIQQSPDNNFYKDIETLDGNDVAKGDSELLTTLEEAATARFIEIINTLKIVRVLSEVEI